MSANPYESPETPGQPVKPTGRRGFRLIELLVIVGIIGLLIACLLPNVRMSRESGRRASCSNNLKQIALALLNYHDEYGSFPPAYTVDAEGKPLHSWRTLILPFNEQKTLYEKIDLSKPWDDPANQAARETDVPAYRCPSANPPKCQTTYVAIISPDGCFSGPTPRTLTEISDGANETLLVTEVPTKQAIPWMSPSDTDEKAFLAALADARTRPHPSGAQAVRADGSIMLLDADISKAALRAQVSVDGSDRVE
jgi:type II secretory pathway pseudopilin PulG